MTVRGSSDPLVLLSWALFRADVGPPEEAFGASLGLIFSQSRLRGPGKGPEGPPKGPGGGPGADKKVVQEGSWRLLADLKTRF